MERERRRVERLTPGRLLTARLPHEDVQVIDIGLLGTRIEHEQPLVDDTTYPLTFVWDGEEFTVDCAVVRSDEFPFPDNDRRKFTSGLNFVGPDLRHSSSPFKRMLDSLAIEEELDRLRTLVEASKLINSSINADEILSAILAVARNELGVERGTLYFADGERKEIWTKIAGELESGEIRLPFGQGLAGTVAATGEAILLHDAYADPRFDRSTDLRTGYRTRSMLCVPIHNRRHEIVGVLQLLNKTAGSFGQRDLDFLASISDHMAIAMENATMHLEIVEKQRMERELQLGREIQGRLLPNPPCDVRNTDLAALSVPCFEVGGDYFDFLELPNGDLGLVIADVSGKGVGAALIMSSVQAALRVAAAIEDDLAVLVARLNGLLHRMTGGRKYVTFFFGRYQPSTGELRFVNAGHNPPMLVHPGGVTKLDSTGRPIGLLGGGTYSTGTVTVPAGATLFLYTDGLNEAANPEEEEFGNERLEALFRSVAERPFGELTSAVIEDISRFERGAHASDDKTVVVLRRRAD